MTPVQQCLEMDLWEVSGSWRFWSCDWIYPLIWCSCSLSFPYESSFCFLPLLDGQPCLSRAPDWMVLCSTMGPQVIAPIGEMSETVSQNESTFLVVDIRRLIAQKVGSEDIHKSEPLRSRLRQFPLNLAIPPTPTVFPVAFSNFCPGLISSAQKNLLLPLQRHETKSS